MKIMEGSVGIPSNLFSPIQKKIKLKFRKKKNSHYNLFI